MFFLGSALELFLISVILLTLIGRVTGHEWIPGPDVKKVSVKEDSDIILPCFPKTMKNIEQDLFDWRKIGQPDAKEVFMYDKGKHYNNGLFGQDKQFKGRVSHFPDQLKYGNASIIIRNTKVADSGNYTCDFPRLQTSQTFHIELVVEFTIKDRSAWIDGAAPKPNVKILDATKDWSLLQCDVRGAFPEPKVEWQDRAGNILPAEEPQVSYRGERYYITLLTTVTKTDHYHCVVKQEEIFHQTEAETFVFIHEKQVEDTKCSTGDVAGWLVGFFLGAFTVVAFGVCLVAAKCITVGFNRGPCQQSNGPYESCANRSQQGNGPHEACAGPAQQRNGPYEACADRSQQGNGSVKGPSDTEMIDISPS